MTRVSAASIFVVCLTTILFVNSITSANVQQPEIEIMAWNDFVGYLCQQGYYVRPADICNAYTTTTTTTSTTTTTTTTTTGKHTTGTTRATTTVEPSTTSTEELTGSALERAHWCQFKNGSYLSLDQTFIYNKCSLCQCIKSRAIRCSNFQCVSAYCLDGSTPYVQDGQCCQQCGYENVSTACVVNGIKFPHGTLLRRTTDNIQCWCQLGSVECRKSSVVSSNSLDLWGNGSTIYVVVVIVIAIVLIGVLLCCAGGIFFYYFYNKNEQTFQEAHDQYYSNAGWQPMSEDGQVVVDEKQVEAGAQQYAEFPTERLSERIPPPYAMYNGTVEQQ